MTRWLNILNLGVAVAICLSLLVFFLIWLGPSPQIETTMTNRAPVELRESPFRSTEGDLGEALSQSPFFALRLNPTTAQLPDLRSQLLYAGRNNRPDVDPSSILLHLSIRGSEETISVSPQERVYLRYTRDKGGAKYAFSDDNMDTGLWVEISLVDSGGPEVDVDVGMVDPQGTPITKPEELAKFRLSPKAGAAGRGTQWKIGEHRADASLLARLRARWYGQDRFLEVAGGDEFAYVQGKERIDFGDGENGYAVFVKEGEGLVWKEGRWTEVEIGPDSRGYPLLILMRQNGKLLNFELWDPDGKSKVQLNLIRSRSPAIHPRLFRKVKVIGTKTHRQTILEIADERVIVGQNDWLLATKEGWRLIDSLDEIDDYVNRRLRGELWIVGTVERRDGYQVLTGLVINSARSDLQKVELHVGSGGKGEAIQFLSPGDLERSGDDEVKDEGLPSESE